MSLCKHSWENEGNLIRWMLQMNEVDVIHRNAEGQDISSQDASIQRYRGQRHHCRSWVKNTWKALLDRKYPFAHTVNVESDHLILVTCITIAAALWRYIRKGLTASTSPEDLRRIVFQHLLGYLWKTQPTTKGSDRGGHYAPLLYSKWSYEISMLLSDDNGNSAWQ
jgi:hypothetical protein